MQISTKNSQNDLQFINLHTTNSNITERQSTVIKTNLKLKNILNYITSSSSSFNSKRWMSLRVPDQNENIYTRNPNLRVPLCFFAPSTLAVAPDERKQTPFQVTQLFAESIQFGVSSWMKTGKFFIYLNHKEFSPLCS